ncbi:helix-turn-helix domain-containing protein [Nocardioides sp. LHG3406-4]|uniref:helix-turn-helix domain-containing protein n=1 Tax=Nocardioides sp. LHG3406-4 TaxID=2804575 RepID=UPI003CF46BCE
MTLSMVPVELDETNTDAAERGWAVVEVRPDGSLGRAELVTATGPVEAAGMLRTLPGQRRPVGSSALDARLGLLQAANGHLAEAAATLSRGIQGPSGVPGQQNCLGHLALVEAYQGDLRRAELHAGLALAARSRADGPGAQHARLAMDWIHFERAEHDGDGHTIDLVEPLLDGQEEPWPATTRLLLQARLLVAARRPDAAVRLLAEATEAGVDPGTGWTSGLLTAARGDALLAAGEPYRALALLTPLPQGAVVEASITIAAACLAIGDVRGADAVLGSVTGALDRAPLAVQLRAWLMEARIADDRGRHDRGQGLVDRALHAAAAEGMRTPVRREWHWVRPLVDRHPGLRRLHRGFLLSLRDVDAMSAVRGPAARSQDLPDGLLGASLTERETQVLELLAQMYSTEEIAAALYVSANTVKTHLKGIFGKLCVNRRVDAVRRGRQLGLC